MTRRDAASAPVVAFVAAVGCVVGRGPTRAAPPTAPGVAHAESAAARGAKAAVARAAGPVREWPLTTAPPAVVDAVRSERDAVSRDNDVTTLDATPVDLDGDGAPEWLIWVETEFPGMVNRPLFAFAERSGVWSRLGFLGAGYEAVPVGAPRGGYAPLCVFERDGPDHVAVEFAWRGTRYEPGARYEPRGGGVRPCEREGVFVP